MGRLNEKLRYKKNNRYFRFKSILNEKNYSKKFQVNPKRIVMSL